MFHYQHLSIPQPYLSAKDCPETMSVWRLVMHFQLAVTKFINCIMFCLKSNQAQIMNIKIKQKI